MHIARVLGRELAAIPLRKHVLFLCYELRIGKVRLEMAMKRQEAAMMSKKFSLFDTRCNELPPWTPRFVVPPEENSNIVVRFWRDKKKEKRNRRENNVRDWERETRAIVVRSTKRNDEEYRSENAMRDDDSEKEGKLRVPACQCYIFA
ncbi:hypothetical protein U1Q18_048062 [Sarracenia purpurea var. burkii]